MTWYEAHPDIDILERHLIDRLPEPENSRVEEHVLVCDSCRQMAAALDEQIGLIREALLTNELERLVGVAQ